MCGTGCININHKNIFVEVRDDKCIIKKNTLDHLFSQIYLYEKSCELLEKTIHYISPLVKNKASKECLSFLEGIHEGAHHFHQACHASFFIYDVLSLISFFKKKQKEKTEALLRSQFSLDLSGPKPFSEKLLKSVITVTRFASHGLYMVKFLQELKVINFPIIALSRYIRVLNVVNFSVQTFGFFTKIAFKFLNQENKKSFVNKLHFSHLIIKTTGLISSTVSVISKLEYFSEYSNLLKSIKKTSGLVNTLFVYWNIAPKSQESYHINILISN